MSSNQRYVPVEDHPRNASVHSVDGERESIELQRIHSAHSATNSTAPLRVSDSPTPNSRLFNSSQQTWRLFFPQFLRWLITVFFVAFLLATLKIYQDKGNFSRQQKHIFNTIITALSLGLGINFFEGFKDIAKVLRWTILASRGHTVREVDLILSIESLSKVIELAWESRKKPLAVLICFLWLYLNLIAQAAVAMIGLMYSADSGTNYKGTYFTPGTVNASGLTCYADNNACPIQPEVQQIVAHTYGEMAQGNILCAYNDISEVITSIANCLFYYHLAPNNQQYAYRFSELNPQDTARIYPRFTNRIITASSGECYNYTIDTTSGQKVDDLNGDLAAYNWSYSNGTVNGSITIPTLYSAFDSTTYIYRGTKIPQNETESSCGPRCMWMWAFKAFSSLTADHNQPMAVYQCPISISPVSNVTEDSQIVSDGMAKLAAASIALQGRYVNVANGQIWTQYQMYPWG